MTEKQFHEGDRVEWDSHGGKAVGEVEERAAAGLRSDSPPTIADVSTSGPWGTVSPTTEVSATMQEESTVKRMTVMSGVLASGVALSALLSGCGAKVEGGDTSCKDFIAANDADQQTAITKMLKDEKGTDPAQLVVTGTRLAVQTYCQTAAKEDSKIKEAPHL